MKMNKIIGLMSILIILITGVFATTSLAITIEGYVFDGSGNAISNANIDLINSSSSIINTTLSDSTGHYSLTTLSGFYKFNISAVTYITQSTGIDVYTSDREKNFTISAEPTGEINGYITTNTNTPIENASVKLTLGNATVVNTLTNSSGYYSLNSTSNTYNLTIEKTDYLTNTTEITITANLANERNITLEEESRIGFATGYAFDENNNTIENLTITAKKSGVTINETKTNSSGYYNLSLEQDSYQLTTSKTGYTSETKYVTITKNEYTNNNISLQSIGILKGTTTDNSNSELNDVNIKIYQNNVLTNDLNTTNNTYSIVLPVGKYYVTANKEGYEQSSTYVTILTGIENITDFSLNIKTTSGSSSHRSSSSTPIYIENLGNKENTDSDNTQAIVFAKFKEKEINITKSMAVTSLKIKLKSETKNVSISVNDLKDVNLTTPQGKVLRYLKIDHKNLEQDNIENATIIFELDKNDVNNNQNIILMRYTTGWNKLETNLINETETKYIYEAITPGFSYFAISELNGSIIVDNSSIKNETTETTPNYENNNTTDQKTPIKDKSNNPYKNLYKYVIAGLLILGIIITTLINNNGINKGNKPETKNLKKETKSNSDKKETTKKSSSDKKETKKSRMKKWKE